MSAATLQLQNKSKRVHKAIINMRAARPVTYKTILIHHTTLAEEISITGKGVHSGLPSTLIMKPAKAETGIVFRRSDLESDIPALWDNVVDTRMCTVLANKKGVSVATVEHVMAAVQAAGITDLIIEVNQQEIPIMDGSSSIFSESITKAGTKKYAAKCKTVQILKTIRVENNRGWAELRPTKRRSFQVTLDETSRLGSVTKFTPIAFNIDKDNFSNLISSARTYGFYEDAQKLWDAGLAKGASLENTVVIEDNKIMNEGGLRFKDEFTRHKVLDAIGDISLAGMPIIGDFVALNPGHSLNNKLLHKLFKNKENYNIS